MNFCEKTDFTCFKSIFANFRINVSSLRSIQIQNTCGSLNYNSEFFAQVKFCLTFIWKKVKYISHVIIDYWYLQMFEFKRRWRTYCRRKIKGKEKSVKQLTIKWFLFLSSRRLIMSEKSWFSSWNGNIFFSVRSDKHLYTWCVLSVNGFELVSSFKESYFTMYHFFFQCDACCDVYQIQEGIKLFVTSGIQNTINWCNSAYNLTCIARVSLFLTSIQSISNFFYSNKIVNSW